MSITVQTAHTTSKGVAMSPTVRAVPIGHQNRTGHHVHDNRPRRQRTRGDALRAAIRD